jgi:hypothetical protein
MATSRRVGWVQAELSKDRTVQSLQCLGDYVSNWRQIFSDLSGILLTKLVSKEPITESVLRPLAPLEPDQQRDAWKTATEISPKSTTAKCKRILTFEARPIALSSKFLAFGRALIDLRSAKTRFRFGPVHFAGPSIGRSITVSVSGYQMAKAQHFAPLAAQPRGARGADGIRPPIGSIRWRFAKSDHF